VVSDCDAANEQVGLRITPSVSGAIGGGIGFLVTSIEKLAGTHAVVNERERKVGGSFEMICFPCVGIGRGVGDGCEKEN
jgi:hypothetical protein